MKKHYFFKLLILLSVSFLAGCANPFADAYTSYYRVPASEFNPHPQVIKCERANFDNTYNGILERGYSVIGSSAFSQDDRYISSSEAYVWQQATNVYADIALYYVTFERTDDQSYYEDEPVKTTAYTRHSNGKSSYTEINTTQTKYVQKLVDIYSYAAFFFKRSGNAGIGLACSDLNSDAHARLGTNKGIIVDTVVRNTPAFYADILKDDVIIEFNGSPVYDTVSFNSMVAGNRGASLTLTIVRNGIAMPKTINLNR
ncbi:PDZ domain-containing protein [bacterium]|nr:PDZ domain-containing protein [bacterium]